MRVEKQSTLAGSVAASGVGLHSGRETRVVLHPAPAGAGIVFRRTDLARSDQEPRTADAFVIPAHASFVAETRLGVRLANSRGVSVMTVEHLMAAFALAGVDAALVEVEGPEIPIFDGSAAPLLDLIDQTGLAALDAPREAIVIRRPLRVEEGDRFVEVVPGDTRAAEVAIDFPDAAIGHQAVSIPLAASALPRERLAAARTFCSLSDIEAMRAAGFGQGGSLDNAIVVDGDRLLNRSGLRDPQEFVLHKALDLIGDLYLAGAPVDGLIRANKPGHDLNTRLAALLVAEHRRQGARTAGETAQLPA